MNNKEEIKKHFTEMDKLLNEAEKEFEDFKKNNQKLKSLLIKTKILEDFYHSDEWMEGREILYKNNRETEFFYSAGEDAIWNLSNAIHKEKLKIIKIIVKSLK